MNYIGENELLIDLLATDYTLLSSTMNKIDIQNGNEGRLYIELHFTLLYSEVCRKIMLRFSEIEEFSFYYNQSHYFYNVEEYKLLKVGDSFYLSLDPFADDANNKVSSKDQDFILCGKVEGFAQP
ncbi:hypothetical protein [Chitinophaga alhagiae]|uniref:hypothetical protein n=1 Tax=Chitinophaga alhagiae TaxID=2203219 RepID=UPI000E5A1B10|nr:hypothetical protein [Chitinophaga alhagiae]